MELSPLIVLPLAFAFTSKSWNNYLANHHERERNLQPLPLLYFSELSIWRPNWSFIRRASTINNSNMDSFEEWAKTAEYPCFQEWGETVVELGASWDSFKRKEQGRYSRWFSDRWDSDSRSLRYFRYCFSRSKKESRTHGSVLGFREYADSRWDQWKRYHFQPQGYSVSPGRFDSVSWLC